MSGDYRLFFEQAARDPEFLLGRIDADLADAPIEQLPIITLSPDEAEAAGYRSVQDGRPRHLLLEALLLGQSDRIRQRLCVEGDYCARKERHSGTVDMMVAVFDSLLSAAVIIPLPLATVAAYCVQSLFLDRLCDCRKLAEAQG